MVHEQCSFSRLWSQENYCSSLSLRLVIRRSERKSSWLIYISNAKWEKGSALFFFFLFLQVLLIKKERLVSLRARKVSRKVIRNTHRVLLSLAYSSMSIVFFQKERKNVAALFSHLFLSLRVFPCVLGEWKKKKKTTLLYVCSRKTLYKRLLPFRFQQ